MFKFVTMYRRVDDEDALEDFFSNTHLQLAERLPHLVKRELSRVNGKPGGESRFHLIFELYFKNEALFHMAMTSLSGLELMKALKPWEEAKLITWFYSESFEEEM